MSNAAPAITFAWPDLTPITGEPTNSSLKLLQAELNANAISIPSNRRGGAHGHLSLIQSPTTSEKESTCILPFVRPSVHVITCSIFTRLEIHASSEEFTCFFHVHTSLVTESQTLFSRGQKNAPNARLIHAK